MAEKKDEVTMESNLVAVDTSSDDVAAKTHAGAFGEAVGVYGNVEAAEKLGYVQRGYACVGSNMFVHR